MLFFVHYFSSDTLSPSYYFLYSLLPPIDLFSYLLMFAQSLLNINSVLNWAY
jgi:hypothetical protein